MFERLSRKRGQTTLEYAILIGVIVAGLITMQVYLKRGLQGKLKESADSMGQQFSPGETLAFYAVNTFTNSQEVLEDEITTTDIFTQQTNRIGSENVAIFNKEVWWGNWE